MPTITERTRASGKANYTAQVRIQQRGRIAFSQAQTFDQGQRPGCHRLLGQDAASSAGGRVGDIGVEGRAQFGQAEAVIGQRRFCRGRFGALRCDRQSYLCIRGSRAGFVKNLPGRDAVGRQGLEPVNRGAGRIEIRLRPVDFGPRRIGVLRGRLRRWRGIGQSGARSGKLGLRLIARRPVGGRLERQYEVTR